MPPHESDLLLAPRKASISFAVEPALNNIHSLIMLSQEKYHSGLGEWVTHMAATLAPERLHINRLVFEGLYSAILPERSWPSFLAYVDYLAAQPHEALRDRVMRAVLRPCPPEAPGAAPLPPPEPAVLLASAEAYVAHLRNIYPDADIDEPIEIETHRLLNNPPVMHDLIISHMRTIWHEALATEWQRVLPMVQESVSAFQQLDLGGLSTLEAARTVTGQDLSEKWEQAVAQAARVVF